MLHIQEIIQTNTYVLLEFGSEGCGPCHALLDKIETWNQKHQEVKFYYLPIDEYRKEAIAFGIYTSPTLLFFVDGQKTITVSGYFSLENYLKEVERYLELRKES